MEPIKVPVVEANGPTVSTTSEGDSWRLWCRLCAKEDPQSNVSVFFKDEQPATAGTAGATTVSTGGGSGDLSLAATIAKYFWVNISREENLPKMLCTECFSLVTALVNFSERVLKVQQMFNGLQSISTKSDKVDTHALRLKYGLLDEEREHVLIPQQQPEVHYFEAKPKINELEEKIFEVATTTTNPLEQSRIKIKIKKENLLEEEQVMDDVDENNDEDEDPFNGDDATCMEEDYDDVDFKPHLLASIETSSSEEEPEDDDTSANANDLKIMVPKAEVRLRKKLRHIPKRKRVRSGADRRSEDEEVNADAQGNADSTDLGERYTCSECPRKFQRSNHYRQHMKRIHSKVIPVPDLQCQQCGRVFSTVYQLDRHTKVHLPLKLKKVLPCPYCEKKFTSNPLVQQHIKFVHMNERSFICEECGMAVRTNGALKEHMLTHTDVAPFECEICKKRFKNQIRLKNHMETHDPDKHICAECGLQLNSRATLNRHLLVHSDEMRHKCDYCGRAFKRAKALKNHLILHTGLKPYSCDFCDRTFANGSNCRSHKKKAHPDELAALEAAGGGKKYTRNIPKLEALKAVTKAADNLTPVVSKQSGCFAFGKKPKPIPKEHGEKLVRQHRKTSANATGETANGIQVNLGALQNVTESDTDLDGHNDVVSSIPTIDNIYNHIMKQATISVHGGNETPTASITIHIKRPPSQASSCAIESESTSDVHHLHLQRRNLQQQETAHSQPPTPTAEHFYTQIVKQSNMGHGQHMPTTHQQHHTLLAQQAQHDELAPMHSPDSQASHITDDHSNSHTSSHFYNQIRQGPSYI